MERKGKTYSKPGTPARGNHFSKDGPKYKTGITNRTAYKPKDSAERTGPNRERPQPARKPRESFERTEERTAPVTRLTRAEPENMAENILYGRNNIREAIRAGRQLDKLLVARDVEPSAGEIIGMVKDLGVPIVQLERSKLDSLAGKYHQGLVAYVAAQVYVEVDDIIRIAKEKDEPLFVLVTDGIEDPHNLGAVIRTAECAGMHGVIIPKRRAVGLTPIVAKASAGAVEHIAVAKVANIAQTLDQLRKAGVWIAGAEADGTDVYKADLKGPLAIVVGGEGEGLGRLIREKCDFIVSLPLFGKVTSLNVSTATAAIVYEAIRQRKA